MSSRSIIIIIMLAVVLLAGFFLTWPEYQKFRQLQFEQGQKKAELDSKASYYSEIKNISARLEEHQDSLLQIENAVSQNYSLPAIFNYLQELSGQTGLVLEDLTFSGESSDGVKEIIFNMEVSGAYPAFKSFLNALESSARLFSVKSISFSSPDKGTAFSFRVTVATYSY